MSTEVSKRRELLTRILSRFEVYQSRDGRPLNELSLYELEWLHIEVRNEAEKDDLRGMQNGLLREKRASV